MNSKNSKNSKKVHKKSLTKKGGDAPKIVGQVTERVFDIVGDVTDVAKKVGHTGLQSIELIGTTTSNIGEKASEFGKRVTRKSLAALGELGTETRSGLKKLQRKISPKSMRQMRESMRRRTVGGQKKEGGSRSLSLNSAVKLLRNYYASKYSN